MVRTELWRAEATRDVIFWALECGTLPLCYRGSTCELHEYWKRRVTELEAAEKKAGPFAPATQQRSTEAPIDYRVGEWVSTLELEIRRLERITNSANEKIERLEELIRHARDVSAQLSNRVTSVEIRVTALAIRVAELEGERQRRETYETEQRERRAAEGPSPYDLGATPQRPRQAP